MICKGVTGNSLAGARSDRRFLEHGGLRVAMLYWIRKKADARAVVKHFKRLFVELNNCMDVRFLIAVRTMSKSCMSAPCYLCLPCIDASGTPSTTGGFTTTVVKAAAKVLGHQLRAIVDAPIAIGIQHHHPIGRADPALAR
jgi:hypothetical protein